MPYDLACPPFRIIGELQAITRSSEPSSTAARIECNPPTATLPPRSRFNRNSKSSLRRTQRRQSPAVGDQKAL
jgi:hypothetical protein